MIFLTVGTQLPFDRLVQIVNDFSLKNPDIEIVGQVGKTQLSNLCFENFESLSIKDFDKYFNQAEIIISHAGMGTILTALTSSKSLFMMARLHEFGEHRNDHQLGTLKKFIDKDYCYGFSSLNELEKNFVLYNELRGNDNETALSSDAPANTIEALNSILNKCMV